MTRPSKPKKAPPARTRALPSPLVAAPEVLEKVPSGISGLDKLTNGGLPRGRPTLVCGGPGSGKTLFAVQTVVRGALEHDEPGVILAFEDTADDFAKNFASFGFPIEDLIAKKLLLVDYVAVERNEIEETGRYDLEGLFVRLQSAVQTIGAKRVAIDTIETIFTGFSDEGLLRAEVRRLFRWLKDHGLTAVVTAERGEKALTRYGLEEYISDCVILLDQRVVDEVATRRLRVVKYRGTGHGTNEYPFLIGPDGISVLPLSALGLSYPVSNDRVLTGVEKLDVMLGGAGYYRGSTVLLSGTAGTGKTSVASHFVDACCGRGERVIYVALEEAEAQILRNMRSIGLDLEKWVRRKNLTFHVARPSGAGLEEHLVRIHGLVEQHHPAAVVIDPISSFENTAIKLDVRAMSVRLIDYLKGLGITTMLTYLSNPAGTEETQIGISSLIDTWLSVRDLEQDGERNRALYVLKSRGMAHSNQVREFLITDRGIDLVDVYIGTDGVLTGSARIARERRDEQRAEDRKRVMQLRTQDLAVRRQTMQAQIEALKAELAREERELERVIDREERREAWRSGTRERMRHSRFGNDDPSSKKS
ncbi:MAG TPA: circadian clock protein KaiC [Polyangiaceae bacterium]|jgi:circadian clock protein KaiC|nr:circadian clock protein KaiC [Polyangiaceae bacterium]